MKFRALALVMFAVLAGVLFAGYGSLSTRAGEPEVDQSKIQRWTYEVVLSDGTRIEAGVAMAPRGSPEAELLEEQARAGALCNSAEDIPGTPTEADLGGSLEAASGPSVRDLWVFYCGYGQQANSLINTEFGYGHLVWWYYYDWLPLAFQTSDFSCPYGQGCTFQTYYNGNHNPHIRVFTEGVYWTASADIFAGWCS